MVFEITRLQFHIEAHTRKDKYESRYPIKERASGHQRRQQGCPVIEREIMAIKDNGRDHNDQEENNNERRRYTQGNQKKHNKREGSCSSIEERGQSNLGRRWSGIHGRKNLCTKQQKDQGGNSEGKS